ncbi:MAG: hypothetical protein HC838_17210 [Spirulinaceae cyanobacterium RM2_2_10]|nr:hypothetical protein [Spirulinaceae cyanobacterium RM2_2_10]
MKRIHLLAGSLLMISGLLTGCGNGFVEFQPVKLQTGQQNKLVPAPELATPSYLERVKVVLEFYGEKYQTNANGSLLIQRKISRDRELLWNYSMKAQDSFFIARARLELGRTNLN